MTPEKKAHDLINNFRVILMNEDTDCGKEILCTSIAIEHAKIVINEFQRLLLDDDNVYKGLKEESLWIYTETVKHYIENYTL